MVIVPVLGARKYKSATQIRHLEPWKIALIVLGIVAAAAITIGLLVYFLAYDQRLFYYSGNLKITNIQYNYEMARRSSGRFRDLSDMIEKLACQLEAACLVYGQISISAESFLKLSRINSDASN
ncbi:hypothetical protein Y1Q_0002104 [Alligator mississippiensis]|uniref:SEA domain-containing protein n=1 Tax=Alligator mississippiensis TaxID=8496 RepID=A0A151MJ13_ALLMI|nr:hypothetical protein Y1Q_0002104 [Alligator mississippiensis]